MPVKNWRKIGETLEKISRYWFVGTTPTCRKFALRMHVTVWLSACVYWHCHRKSTRSICLYVVYLFFWGIFKQPLWRSTHCHCRYSWYFQEIPWNLMMLYRKRRFRKVKKSSEENRKKALWKFIAMFLFCVLHMSTLMTWYWVHYMVACCCNVA